MDCTHAAQNRDKWPDLVKSIMHLRSASKMG